MKIPSAILLFQHCDLLAIDPGHEFLNDGWAVFELGNNSAAFAGNLYLEQM